MRCSTDLNVSFFFYSPKSLNQFLLWVLKSNSLPLEFIDLEKDEMLMLSRTQPYDGFTKNVIKIFTLIWSIFR